MIHLDDVQRLMYHHRARAERELDKSDTSTPDNAEWHVAKAQVHATLALSYDTEFGARAI